MPQLTKNLTGIIIGVSPRAERYVRWDLLSASEGFVSITVPQKLATPLGLFDTLELVATSRGKGLFLKEPLRLNRPDALAQNLQAFTEAARLAKIIRAVFGQMPDYKPIYEIFKRALCHYSCTPSATEEALITAAERKPRGAEIRSAISESITLKAFYKMLSAEGFPVSQGWLSQLPSAQRKRAQALLAAPKFDLSHADPKGTLESLIDWVQRELDVRVYSQLT